MEIGERSFLLSIYDAAGSEFITARLWGLH
jgi:hypothetical protein